VFAVTYLEYNEDVSQTQEWIFLKGVVDEQARRGVEEEQTRGYLPDEDSDFEDQEEDKEPEGQGIPSTS